MLGALLRRGLVAGLLAGLLAGLVALAIGKPPLDEAIALEEAAAAGAPAAEAEGLQEVTISRAVQQVGLVVGTGLVGVGVGALFAVAAAWSMGRLQGDDWQRSLKLGAVLVAAVVLLPALAYPPLPPGGGDPRTVDTRAALYLGTVVVGVLLAGAAHALAVRLARTDLTVRLRQLLVTAAVIVAAAVLLVALPAGGTADGLPAELLWTFRLSSVATQLVLWGGTAVVFGLLSSRRASAIR